MQFKKVFLAGAAALLAFNAFALEKITIGATPTPHGEIVAFTQALFEKRGYALDFKEFSDYLTPNFALNDKELDANLYQHVIFLEDFNKNKGTQLVALAPVVVLPMAIYSNKIKDLKDLKEGATVALPNDPTNESRSLDLLEKAGLATFKKVAQKTPLDIVDNPKKLKFKEVEAAQVPRALEDVDLGVVTTNYALGAGLNPQKDGIFMEDKENRYAVMVLAVRKGEENSAKAKVMKEVFQSPEVAQFIQEKFDGAAFPAF